MAYEEHRVNITQKTFVFNDEGKFLTLFRTDTAPVRPLTWDLPGGLFELGESPEDGARREIREEAGLEVGPLSPISVRGRLNDDNQYWVTIAYKAEAITTEVTLSFEHNDFKWVTAEEFLDLESSERWKSIVRDYLL